ncbi:hypothetical protein Tco_1329895 [Tanacetum coccineum]
MHTIMVPKQVKTLKIQAGVQVLRLEDREDVFSIGRALEDVIFVLLVLVRNFPRTQDNICGNFIWKDDLRLRISFSSRPLRPSTSFLGASTRPSYSPVHSIFAPSLGNVECSNWRALPGLSLCSGGFKPCRLVGQKVKNHGYLKKDKDTRRKDKDTKGNTRDGKAS